MKVDGSIGGVGLADIAASARALEAAGYDGGATHETSHDPFLSLVVAAEHTERLELRTSIAVAFARSPMTLAGTASDLQRYSRGRFTLGLGSQVKAHIEKRFSMPWSHPAARISEFVLAMRAIWTAWDTDGTLDFRGDHYQHTLMTPFFNPGPNPYGHPKVVLAAVGEMMTEVAGEVADGMILHSFTTERYVREHTMPALAHGLERAGRDRDTFEISLPLFVVTGSTEEELTELRRKAKEQVAFYGSTPSYHAVLETHGWGDLQGELNGLAKRGTWVEMGELITDDMLDAFAIVCENPDDVATTAWTRWGDLMDRATFYMFGDTEPGWLGPVRVALRAL